MTSREKDAKEAISRHFDCSDSKNIGNGGKGGLTNNNIRAVYRYTGQSDSRASEIVNPLLRYISKLPEDERVEYLNNSKEKIGFSTVKTFIKQMDEAISKVELPPDLILYRGVDYQQLTDDIGYEIELGVIYGDAGFMSTSYMENVAYRFAIPHIFEDGDIARRPIFVIKTKSGLFGAVSHNECEVILPRRIVLKCVDIIDLDDRRYFIMDYLTVNSTMGV